MGVFGKHLFQNDSAMDSIESLKSAGIEKFLSSLLKVGDNESDDSGPYDFEVDDSEPYDFEVDDFEVDDFEPSSYGSDLVIVAALFDGIINNTKYDYYDDEFNEFVLNNKGFSPEKHISDVLERLKKMLLSNVGFNNYMERSSVYINWKCQILEIMERLALFQLGFEKIGFEIFINSTDLINKIKTNPYSGEWVMIVDKQSRDTRIEVLNIKNKDKVLKNYDVFKLEKVFGNKILTATDLYRSNRRDNLNNICYRPVFSNVDVDLDWFIPTASFKKLKEKTKISVFLCHSFDDKKSVRDLYEKLLDNNINAWIDEKDLIPGQDWKLEIEIALTRSNIVLICLSNNSISKVGFVQKEIKYALDKSEEYPEGIIYIMPIRLEDCILPERLKKFHTIDYFKEGGLEALVNALKHIELTRFEENNPLLNY